MPVYDGGCGVSQWFDGVCGDFAARGTLQILHISELGAIAAHDPKKAEEIISGGFNTVHQNGVIIKESTHEGGQYGLNYELTVAAMDMVGKELTPLDFRFFFFSWIRQPGYRIVGGKAPVEPKMVKYFASLEEEYGIVLDDEQKCWYAAMARTQRKIRQEFPTVPDEALNPVAEGTIFGSQINMLRELGRLTAEFEADAHLPVYTAWDIGLADFMSIWWIQPGRDGKFYVLDNYTANGRTLDHYIGELRKRETAYGRVAECFCRTTGEAVSGRGEFCGESGEGGVSGDLREEDAGFVGLGGCDAAVAAPCGDSCAVFSANGAAGYDLGVSFRSGCVVELPDGSARYAWGAADGAATRCMLPCGGCPADVCRGLREGAGGEGKGVEGGGWARGEEL